MVVSCKMKCKSVPKCMHGITSYHLQAYTRHTDIICFLCQSDEVREKFIVCNEVQKM